MKKPTKVVFLAVLFLSVFSAGCSNQGNNFNNEISDSPNSGETAVESSDPADDVNYLTLPFQIPKSI